MNLQTTFNKDRDRLLALLASHPVAQMAEIINLMGRMAKDYSRDPGDQVAQIVGYIKGWNDALEAGADLFRDGFTSVRRRVGNDLNCRFETLRGDAKIEGDYEEATHVTPSELDVAAILSLKQTDQA